MDRTIVFALIPIMALAIPVAAIIFNGIQKVAKLRLEETRLRFQGDSAGSSEDIQALHQEVDSLRQELGELQERMDFAERMLARSPAQPKLPPPGEP